MAQHGSVQCSCGTVLWQCRCPGPHTTETREGACAACQEEAKANAGWQRHMHQQAYDDLLVLAAYVKAHFPWAWEAQPRHGPLSAVVIGLLAPLLAQEQPGVRPAQGCPACLLPPPLTVWCAGDKTWCGTCGYPFITTPPPVPEPLGVYY